MPRFPRTRVRQLFLQADGAPSREERGAILEAATRILFEAVPGVTCEDQDVPHAANTEEIDLLFWNDRKPRALHFIDAPFLAECKNWAAKVSGQEIVVFANSMRGRSCRDGILIAANGITGDPGQLTEAHFEISVAARSGQRILVLTRQEIESFEKSADLVTLLKTKVLDVARKGTKIA